MACHVFLNVRLGGGRGCAWGSACAGVTLRPSAHAGLVFCAAGGSAGPRAHITGACSASVRPNLNSRFGGWAGGENSEGPRRDSGALGARPLRAAGCTAPRGGSS